LRFIFGRDIFISYSRQDANKYAPALVMALKERNKQLTFYLDRWLAPSSSTLPASLERHLRWSSLMVVICTEHAVFPGSFVRDEILLFGRLRRKMIPIDVDHFFETLCADEIMGPLLGGEAPEIETWEAIGAGRPTEEVINRVVNAIDFTTQQRRLSFTVWSAVLLILLIGAGATATVARARNEITNAQNEVESAQAVRDNALQDANSSRKIQQAAEKQTSEAIRKQWEALTQQQLDYIELTMEKAPTNLIRRRELEKLFTQAHAHGLLEIEQQLIDLINAVPKPEMRLATVYPDRDRFAIVLSPSGRYLIVTAHSRIEIRNPTNLKVIGTLATRDLKDRHGGRIIWFAPDPTSDAISLELEYSDFATVSSVVYRDYSSKRTLGELEVEGNDREIIRVEIPSLQWSSVGFSQVANLHRPYDLERHLDYHPSGTVTTSREAVMEREDRTPDLLKHLPKAKSYIIPPYSSPTASLLARDDSSEAQVFELIEWPPDMAEAGPPSSERSAVLYTADKQVLSVTGRALYKPGSEPISVSDQETTLGQRPNFTPAAVNMKVRRLVLRDKLYSVDHDRISLVGKLYPNWDSIERISIVDDGSIIAFGRDGTLSQWKAGETTPRHTLLAINKAIARAISSDAKRIYLLRPDGELELWRMDAFDSTGWASHLQ
jgi:hypothetical protein